ncbi:hypothetical protein BG004_000898, partial [Podila humilis]
MSQVSAKNRRPRIVIPHETTPPELIPDDEYDDDDDDDHGNQDEEIQPMEVMNAIPNAAATAVATIQFQNANLIGQQQAR